MTSNISTSAFILAGGKSERFKQDKSLYEFKGKPLIQHVFDALTPVFSDISIIANDIEKYKFLKVETYPDIIPGLGPIGGIYTALQNALGNRVFVCACDMPSLNSDFIKYMLSILSDYDVIIPMINNYYQPLHAIYSKSCIDTIKYFINNGEKQVIKIFNNLSVRPVSEEEISFYDDPLRIFQNINYKEEIQNIIS